MKTSSKIQSLVREIIVALFVLLFLYTAIDKFMGMARFRMALGMSPLTEPYAVLLSWTVPLFETIAVLLLIIPRTRYLGLIISTFIMMAFTIYIGYMLMSSSKLPCRCGGVISSMSWEMHLLFNTVFVTLGLTGTFLYTKDFIMMNRSSRTPVKYSRQNR